MDSTRASFREYVAGRRQHLHRAAYLLCGDPHRAEDLVQIALTKLYVAWPRVVRADSVDAYVRRALVNTHISESRRPWRRERAGIDGLPDPVAPAVAAEHDDDLWAALAALSPGQRRVVVLRHYWGLSVEETAADLGISTGTVKSQTSAGLARLRVLLDEVPEVVGVHDVLAPRAPPRVDPQVREHGPGVRERRAVAHAAPRPVRALQGLLHEVLGPVRVAAEQVRDAVQRRGVLAHEHGELLARRGGATARDLTRTARNLATAAGLYG